MCTMCIVFTIVHRKLSLGTNLISFLYKFVGKTIGLCNFIIKTTKYKLHLTISMYIYRPLLFVSIIVILYGYK